MMLLIETLRKYFYGECTAIYLVSRWQVLVVGGSLLSSGYAGASRCLLPSISRLLHFAHCLKLS